MPWVAEQLLDRGALDDAAGIHDEHLLADFGDDAKVVADQQYRHADFALQPAQQIEDLRLHGNIERRGRLVGDEEVGPAGEGHGDHGALAQAAGELVRILVKAALGRADAHHAEDVDRFTPRLGLAHAAVDAEHLGDLVANTEGGVQAGHRLLEDHADAIASNGAHFTVVECEEIVALE